MANDKLYYIKRQCKQKVVAEQIARDKQKYYGNTVDYNTRVVDR